MQDEPNNANEKELDEIDKFLATLPSLHIPEDMVDEGEYKVRYKPKHHKVQLTSVFALMAWLFFLFSLVTVLRAFPGNSEFWYSIRQGNRQGIDTSYFTTAAYYLFGNIVVCLGGLAICLAQKKKIFGGSALNFWIAGVLSGIAAVALTTL
jgi:hypothetical protein